MSEFAMEEIAADKPKRRRGSRRDFTWETTQKHAAPRKVVARGPFEPVEIVDYDGLIHALRARVEHLGISRETVSALAKLPSGYAQKVLSLRKTRRIGMQSLSGFLDALGVKLVLVEDPSALKRNRSRYKPRDEAHFRSARAGHDQADLTRWAAARGLIVTVDDDAISK